MHSAPALRVCVLVAALFVDGAWAAELEPIKLWPDGAPGSDGRNGPEHVRLTEQGEHIVSNVHSPTITPYLPDAGTSTGVGIVVIPGGGHRELWMDHEGYRVGTWLRQHGIAAFVLKYRLAKEEGSTYTVEGTELADVQRAIRLVKSRAAKWHVRADRVGIVGFSAGGELGLLAGTRLGDPLATAADAIDSESSRPAFMGLIYPGMPAHLALSKGMPPAFLLCGENDGAPISEGLPQLYLSLKRAGVSAELHILAGAGHGFGMRAENPPGVANWIVLFRNWLDTQGFTRP